MVRLVASGAEASIVSGGFNKGGEASAVPRDAGGALQPRPETGHTQTPRHESHVRPRTTE